MAGMNGFKCQITLEISLCKDTKNAETKYSPPIYFSSNTQIVINDLNINYSLKTSYQMVFIKSSKMNL